VHFPVCAVNHILQEQRGKRKPDQTALVQATAITLNICDAPGARVAHELVSLLREAEQVQHVVLVAAARVERVAPGELRIYASQGAPALAELQSVSQLPGVSLSAAC
jgi:hypothetical protein